MAPKALLIPLSPIVSDTDAHSTSHDYRTPPGDPPSDVAFLQPYLSPSLYEFCASNVGLLLVALTQFFIASMNITVRFLISTSNLSIPTIITVRMSITGACCAVTLLILGDPHPFLGPPEVRRLLFFRGLFGFISLVGNYLSFRGLKVSDSTAIQFLCPSITTMLGFVALGEKCSRTEIIAGLCCLGGVLVISRPPFFFGEQEVYPIEDVSTGNTGSRMVGVIWAICSVFSAAITYIIIRFLGKSAHALHSIAYYAYICSIVSVLAMVFTPGPVAWVDTWGGFSLIILIGIFGFVAQMLLTMGIQRERVGRAGIALYTSVFFALILELVVFHTLPSLLSLLGTSIILTSAFWVARSSMKINIPEDVESEPVMTLPDSPSHSPRQASYDYIALPTRESTKDSNRDPISDTSKVDRMPKLEGYAIADGYDRLQVRREGLGGRTSSATSEISGFTSVTSD